MTFHPDGPPEGRPLSDRVRQDLPRLSGPDFRPLQDSPMQPIPPGTYWPTDIRPVTGYLPSPPYLPAQPVYIARPTALPTSGLAVTSIILALLGFAFIAVLVGCAALPEINNGTRAGKGWAVAGIVLGMAGTVLWIVFWIGATAAVRQ